MPFFIFTILCAQANTMTSYIIGIDIGTGSTKAVAINQKGEALFTTQASYPTLNRKPGYSEQNPELLWRALATCLNTMLDHFKQQPAGVSLSSAMHSVIAVDASGNALADMITWADNRSAAIANRLRVSAGAEMLYKQTGTPLHTMSPLCKIIWLKENESELFERTHKFISIKEFIWHKLFNVFEIDHSIASATGLFDIEKLSWNDNALLLAGLTRDKLSQPVRTEHQRKNIQPSAKSLSGISEEVPFIIGASDGCMANLGSFATNPGVAALTIGTSGAIRVGNTKPTHNFNAMNFNYVLDDKTYISGGPINNGGIILKWYIQTFLNKDLSSEGSYENILRQMETIEPGANGLIFLPYLLGERAPIWNSDARGVFFGISNQHQQAHFTRAVIEGITMALYHVADGLEDSGLSINQINVSGGFVRSEAWIQILANIFNKKVCLINPEDASALGAGYMALKSLSMIRSYDALMPEHITTFLPDPELHKRYKKNFSTYKKIYENLRVLMNHDPGDKN